MPSELAPLYKALAKAQSEFTTVKQTAENPFFKSKYAELRAYDEMIKPILSKYGLSYSQSTRTDERGIGVKTILYHESGESIKSDWLSLRPDKDTPQGGGSAITYARRYSLTAFLGLVSEGEDDDGNAASQGGGKKPSKKPAKQEAEADKTIEEVSQDILKCTSIKHLKNIYDKYSQIFTGKDLADLTRAKDVKKGELS